MRRALAERRAMRHAATCQIVTATATRDAGGAHQGPPSEAPAGTAETPCRLLPRITGLSAGAAALMEEPRGGVALALAREVSISAGDWLFYGGVRYRVVSAPPLRETDVYRTVELEEHR